MATQKFNHMKRTSETRSNAATENRNQVNNRKSSNAPKQTPVSASDAPKGVKVEDLEARLKEYNSDLSKAKKQSQKSSENLTKVREQVENQRYVVAVQRANNGTASAEDLQIIASRKTADNINTALAKFFANDDVLSEAEKTAWDSLHGEVHSVTSAIAETLRLWNKGFDALYKSIGVGSKKALTPALLKGLCPFMQVASADGLKAAMPGRRAVRKNGKAVKKNGKKVYKYTLRAVTNWNAENLYKVLRANYRMMNEGIFSEDETATRKALLEAEVSALKALKAAKDAQKSEHPSVAYNAAQHEDALKAAAKAAGQAVKDNAATIGSDVVEQTKKVVNG